MKGSKSLLVLLFLAVFTITPAMAQIVNGDFETGDFTGWTVTGPHVANVIQHLGSWCGHIHINAGSASGSWTPNNMYEMVSQDITIAGVNDSLRFAMEVSGSSWHDGGKVWIEASGVYTQLFYTGSGGGSAQYYPPEIHTVSLGQWAGQIVTMSFSGHNWNGYGDHVCDIYFDNVEYIAGEPDTIPPEVTVDVPNGGEVWVVGEEREILWTADDDIGVVTDSVFYSTDDGVTWEFVAEHIGNPQTHTWTVPNTPSAECLVKVVVYDGSGNSDEDVSDGVFTIAADNEPPTVTVLTPNGGEMLPTGGFFTITWEADDNVSVFGDTLFLSLDGGVTWEVIDIQSGNPQSYYWNIPFTPSTECKVKVVVYDGANNTAADESDSVFEIYYMPSFIVNGDFETGDFTGWTVTGPHVANVIQHQGSWCAHIHINWGSASGSATPNNMYEMVSQEVTISSVNDSLRFDMEVSGSSWHDGGEVWLEDNGAYYRLFHTGGGGGSATYYPWETHCVSLGDWAGLSVTLSFTGDNSNGYGDHVCDIYFDNIEYIIGEPDTIPPEVTVDVPNGGEVWLIGEEQEILWTADDNVGVVIDSVFYSTDNGTTWEFIAAHSGNPQTHTWTVPDTPSDECLVKVVVYDGSGLSDEDVSDGVFSIVTDEEPPTVTVISPNGGEVMGTGSWFTVTWEADDNVAVLGDSLFHSIDGGATWVFINDQTGNPQTYSWHIPNTPSEECLFKVVVFDACGNCAEDISDGEFTIFYQEPPPVIYAVVIKQSTYNIPGWGAVADTLLQRYQGQLFIWNSSLYEVQSNVAMFGPTHIAFVCEALTANASFVQNSVWPFTRGLDADPYGDAVWGIITGYTAEDAMRLSTCPGFTVRTMLGGTGSADAYYYAQGINTNEATYGQYSVKVVDSIGTTSYSNGPTDRTEWLMTMINEGIEMFNGDPVDIFVTSGHGNHDQWQLHYPTSGSEGFFRSSNGQLYGDPYSGANINANSINPKIYFALGNCYVGKIQSMSSMAPAWIHTGGAYLVTGYVITEGSYSHQHGGTKAFFARQGLYTWPEAFFLANQNLYFDIQNNTPGANPPDLNGSALYGDPALDARLDLEYGVIPGSMYTEEILVSPGVDLDTVTVRITMNRSGSPGYTSKWGNRHPTVLLPFRADNVNILSHNCMNVVITDNFALLYVWHQGQGELPAGTMREVVFTCSQGVGGLAVTMEPTNPPVQIPASGGSFDFTVQIENTSSFQTFVEDLWIDATLPNGTIFGPIITRLDLNFAPGANVSRSLNQSVPGGAPVGDYIYWVHVGDQASGAVTVEDSFPFTKLGDDGSGVMGEWTITGWDEPCPDTHGELPSNYHLSQNNPNPFNPITNLTFSLPAGGNVELVIYDIQGREVVRLVDGYRNAGVYQATFDGSQLASGVYFANIKVNDFSQTRKLLLVK